MHVPKIFAITAICQLWYNCSLSPIQLMIHPDPTRRPSASDLIRHPALLTAARMSADQLRIELNAEKFKNALLQK